MPFPRGQKSLKSPDRKGVPLGSQCPNEFCQWADSENIQRANRDGLVEGRKIFEFERRKGRRGSPVGYVLTSPPGEAR